MLNNDAREAVGVGCAALAIGCFSVVAAMFFWLGLFGGACWIVKQVFFS